ncbi:MAG: GNAT family N-acetyltransferase [Actinomycetota bacterium]
MTGSASPVTVREASPHEYAEAGRVTAEAYRQFAADGDDDWHEYLEAIADVEGRADRTTIFIALDGDRIVGSATLELFDRVEREDDPTLHPEESHIRMLGVHPDARRRGVARALMDACFERARNEGKRFMSLHTTERIRDAQRMYEALGFERLDDRVFPDGFVLLTYRRPID